MFQQGGPGSVQLHLVPLTRPRPRAAMLAAILPPRKCRLTAQAAWMGTVKLQTAQNGPGLVQKGQSVYLQSPRLSWGS
jgi:hypothetical protein